MIDWFGNLEFREPWLLLAALLAVPVYLMARQAPGAIVFSSFRALPQIGGSWRSRLSWLPDAFLALGTVSLGLALAGPRIGQRNSEVHREGIAIMMVIDISGSMQALDLSTQDQELTRLDAVKAVFEEFVIGGDGLSGRPDDAVGIVTFARYADTACPLTLDHANLVGVARTLEIVTARSEDGTAIGDGLGLAVQRLRESKARSRIAVVLTDGVNNAGFESPLGAAELARSQGIKVYTIGAGTTGMAPVRVRDSFTGRSVLRSMAVEIDEITLREVADRTGGSYFRATDADALREVYQEIDHLERTRITEEHWRQYDEYYAACLALGLCLAAVGWLTRGTLFRRLP
jgi:Ca-activated chloride channel family protein